MHSRKSLSPTIQLPIEQHLVHIPFFVESDGFTSVLTLNNNMPQQTSVDVTLFNLNGQSLTLPTISLAPELPSRFDIDDLTRQAKAGQFSSGNLAFAFSGVEEGVTAQVSIISASRRQAFESSDNETDDFKTSRLDGILWAPDAQSKASLALTNTSNQPLTVSGSATTSLGLQSIKAELAPHATQVVDVTRFVITGALSGEPTNAAPALMTLLHGGNPGDLMVPGFVTNDKTGFSCNLPFVDGATMVSNHLAAAHIRMNQAAAIEGFPVGTRFSAPVVLANIGGASSQAAISVEYTLASIPHRIQLPSVTLGPREIQQIDLAQALAARGVLGPLDDAGIDIIYSGAPGTVIGRLTSLDQTRDFSFDVPVKDPLAGTNRVNGDYPWRLDSGFKTVVHIKNVLDAPVQAEVQIRYDGGTYNPALIPLQPHQTIDLDIGAMRDAQQPDIRGSVMPKDVVSGQLIWVEMTPGSLIGRAEASNVSQGIASSFSCSGPSNCSNSLFSTALSPNSATLSVGDSTIPFLPLETDQNCLGDHFGPNPASAIITWSSTNTSVATVDQTGNVTAVGPGTATISAQWQAVVYECGNFCTQVTAEPVATGTVSIVQADILMGTTKVTNETQDVIVGEQIPLSVSVLPAGTSITNPQWSIPGTTVGGYAVTYTNPTSATSASVIPTPSLSASSVTYYWVDGADARQVKFSYKVNGKSFSVATTFNVKRPTSTFSSTSVANVTVDSSCAQLGGLNLRYGCNQMAPGITFDSTTTIPSGFSGDTALVQVGTSISRDRFPGGVQKSLKGSNVLDTTFPFPFSTGTMAFDAPAQPFGGSDTQVDATDSYTIWLIFKPSNANSIWVPLKQLSWSWAGVASRTVLFSSSHSSNQTGADTTTHPTWSGNIVNLTFE